MGGGDESGEELCGRRSRRWALDSGRGVPSIMLGGDDGKGAGFSTASLAVRFIRGVTVSSCGAAASASATPLLFPCSFGWSTSAISESGRTMRGCSPFPLSPSIFSSFTRPFCNPGNSGSLGSLDCCDVSPDSSRENRGRFVGRSPSDASDTSASLLLPPVCCSAASN